MGDMGDDFNALKKFKQKKRADNREQSAEILRHAGIVFESKNMGAHLIVRAGRIIVDFWPGTGLWLVRGASAAHQQRGVRKLIQYVEKINVTDFVKEQCK